MSINVTEFLKFVLERHAMYTRRMSGQTPLTLDPHLRDWRYCNMYRELDTVTAEIRTRWREPNEADPNLFLAMAIARFVNLPEALWDVGYPHAWDPTAYKAKMAARQAAGLNVEGGAYMIPSIGDYPEGTSKFVGHADLLFTPMWAARERLRPHEGDTLATFHARLCEFDGVGDFLGGQIVADVKYVKPLLDAADWWTWAVAGPGSIKGLNAVMGRLKPKRTECCKSARKGKPCDCVLDTTWPGTLWFDTLTGLIAFLDPKIAAAGLPRLHAQDWQNALCEYSGYYRVKVLGGRKKHRYPPTQKKAKKVWPPMALPGSHGPKMDISRLVFVVKATGQRFGPGVTTK